ncbi:MAG: SH3 domain-containing protein, partial [Clostridia bacterium]|nr:SH3 domain-containing protein [Clostridia bacterium]
MKRLFAVLLIAVMLVSMAPAVSLADMDYATVVGGWLRLRAGASYDAETISSFYTGTQVEILGVDDDWYLVKTPDGRTGYMHSDYLKVDGGAPSTETGNAVVTSPNGGAVRMRQGPGTGYRVVAAYGVGTPVMVLQRGSYWSKVSINGLVGYMMTQYLSFGGGSYDPGTGSVVCYASIWSGNGYGVRLRTGPGTGYEKIGVYSVGTTVAVLQKGAVWDKIRVGSRVGWMMNQFLRYHNGNEVTNVTLNNYTPVVGDRLQANVSPSWATVNYQWKRNGGAIYGANGSSYVVTSADIGTQLSVTVTGYGSYSGARTSAATADVGSSISRPTITTDSVAAGEVGTSYSAQLNAQGGGSISWQLVSGSSLPAGLSLSSSGVISGKPTVAGTTTFFVVAYNAAGTSDVKSYTLKVAAPAPTYTLKVINGAGGTSGLRNGDTVSISANTPGANQKFIGWQLVSGSGNFHNASALNTTFTISGSNAEVKARYETVSAPVVYSLTIHPAGTVVTNLKVNDKVQITAPAPASGMQFDGWTLEKGNGNFEDSTSATTWFHLNGSDATVRANYTAEKTYKLTVEGGSGSATGLKAGDTVAISANTPAANQQFTGWKIVSGDGNFYNSTAVNTTFTMKDVNTVIKASYTTVSAPVTYKLTVIDGSGDSEGLAVDARVRITAEVPSGKVFTHWQLMKGNGNFYNSKSETTDFYLNGTDATVQAFFTDAPSTVSTFSAPIPEPEP